MCSNNPVPDHNALEEYRTHFVLHDRRAYQMMYVLRPILLRGPFACRNAMLPEERQKQYCDHGEAVENVTGYVAPQFSHGSVDTVFPLQFTHIGCDHFNVALSQTFNWRHVSELPVV